MTVKQQPTTPPSGSIKSLTVPLAPECRLQSRGEGLTVAEAARRLSQFGPNWSRPAAASVCCGRVSACSPIRWS